MGEKGLSGTAGDETFDDDVFDGPPAPEPQTDNDRAWQPEREPAYASDPVHASDEAAPDHEDAPGVAYGG